MMVLISLVFSYALLFCTIALCGFILRHYESLLSRQYDELRALMYSSKCKLDDGNHHNHKPHRVEEEESNDSTRLLSRCSLLLQVLLWNSSRWDVLLRKLCTEKIGDGDGDGDEEEVVDLDKGLGEEEKSVKKRKKRVKKKVKDLSGEEKCGGGGCGKDELSLREMEELVWMYPFTTPSSTMQRKIKQQFDELVKCHGSKKMTLAQIGQFADCLIQARRVLQHKSEAIKRKFTIAKALLHKADRSSYDRHSQQIHKLEMEQKRLEEDAHVYNLLQHQLKLSPAYKKMLEISVCLDELKSKPRELAKLADAEFANISFEDFLAKEKKDSFWQRNGKLRSYPG